MNLKINFLENIQNIKSSTSDVLVINIEHSILVNIIVKLIKSSEIICFKQKIKSSTIYAFLKKFIKGGPKIE